MRVVVYLLLAAMVVAPRVAHAQPRADGDLGRARALDQQGARAFAEGHYNDAIRYFEESHRLGGPPFELWNIARCRLRLDQPEQAAELLERYLATPSLPAEDREEATQQLEALRRRPSTVTIASSPSGATVAVDGKRVEGARTPTSFSVPPGAHTVTLTLPSHAVYTQKVEARYGRAIILDAPLTSDGRGARGATEDGRGARGATEDGRAARNVPDDARGEAASGRAGQGEPGRVALRGDLGVMLPRYGSVGGSASAALAASGVVRLGAVGATTFGLGLLVHLTGDSWFNTVGAPDRAQPCGALSGARSAAALSLFAVGTAGWELTPRIRAHALAGAGAATYFAGDLGGDVFTPACSPSPAPKPALLLGAQLDYALTPVVRLSALPLLLQVQPAFDGARTTPVDASGAWLRATFALGAGVDL